jgi:hypothetical protein
MEYFLICQDNRIFNYPEPLGISKTFLQPERPDQFSPVQFQLRTRERIEYVDFIAKPLPLVSDELKRLLNHFEKAARFTPVVLADMKRGTQRLYWSLEPPKTDCLSDRTEFNKDGTVKRLALRPFPAAGPRMFRIDRVKEDLIVLNLVLVESLLRRDLLGFRFSRIETEPEE